MNSRDNIPAPQMLNRHAYTMVNDKHLSFRAKGLWFYMQMKPDGWDFCAKRIALETKEGVRAIQEALKDLEYLGYLTRRKLSNGRVCYKLFKMRDGPNAPFLGDYDFEFSNEFSPWREDCWSALSSANYEDSYCSTQKLYEHLYEMEGIEDSTAWAEAEEWEKSCKEADVGQTRRNAKKWIDHVKRKYPKNQNAKTADISSLL